MIEKPSLSREISKRLSKSVCFIISGLCVVVIICFFCETSFIISTTTEIRDGCIFLSGSSIIVNGFSSKYKAITNAPMFIVPSEIKGAGKY